MASFSWLLISDLHLKSDYTTWNQSVVLRDMIRDIELRLPDIPNISFVIVSGDLAHGGKADQYKLVEAFLDELVGKLGLTRADVYLVPGNHDIDRKVNELAFFGSRSHFTDAHVVERLLSNERERNLLTSRLNAYYEFERAFCDLSDRQTTDDGLAYLAVRQIGDLPIGIVGFNSAIACGDDSDERNIVIADRPMIDACELVRGADIRLSIGVLHHPPVWLRGFDGRTFQERVMPMIDVMHRGHLHEPGVKPIVTSPTTNCLEIAAGAGFFWRQFDNSYSVVTFEVERSECTTHNYIYDSHPGTFSESDCQVHTVTLRGEIPGTTAELISAIETVSANAKALAPLLGMIVEGQLTDIPIANSGKYYFASVDLLRSEEDQQVFDVVGEFIRVRNSLLAFRSDCSIAERIAATSGPISAMADLVVRMAEEDSDFSEIVERKLKQARELTNAQPSEDDSFTVALSSFAAEQDWPGLHSYAERYIDDPDATVRHSARYFLALASAHSEDAEVRGRGKELALQLIEGESATVGDSELAFSICRNQQDDTQARRIALEALDKFAPLPNTLVSAVTKFIGETGDSDLKNKLDEVSNVQ